VAIGKVDFGKGDFSEVGFAGVIVAFILDGEAVVLDWHSRLFLYQIKASDTFKPWRDSQIRKEPVSYKLLSPKSPPNGKWACRPNTLPLR
jgi:hypothetical protein